MVFSLFLFEEEAQNCSLLTFYGGMPPPSLKRIMFAKQVTLLLCEVPTEFLVLYHYFPMLFYKRNKQKLMTVCSICILIAGLCVPKRPPPIRREGLTNIHAPHARNQKKPCPLLFQRSMGNPLSTSRKSILNGVLKFFEALKSSFYIYLQ